MTNQEIQTLLDKQRAYFRSGATIPVDFRIAQLKKLYACVKKYETEVNDALKADLGKSHYEGFMCESGLVLSEISYIVRHTRRLAKRKTVYTPLAQFASHSSCGKEHCLRQISELRTDLRCPGLYPLRTLREGRIRCRSNQAD